MTYQMLVTSRALQQLVDMAHWWAKHRSVEQAVRWLDGFEAAIASLANTPEQQSLARESELYDLPYPARQLLYGLGNQPTHRAVFEIRGDTVFVVAIRHLAQDTIPAEEL
jgi:plasmid stabilization system protein ParE